MPFKRIKKGALKRGFDDTFKIFLQLVELVNMEISVRNALDKFNFF